MTKQHIEALRDIIERRAGTILPGAANALTARVVEDLGFEALYLTGAGLTNMYLGVPDLGFMDLSQLVDHTMMIRGVTDLPVIVDADTGFGNAVNVHRSVKMLEMAGASAIQLEDQASPKRCGHFDGKQLIGAQEMAAKIRAATDARREGMLIMARTDARAGEGFQAALDRAALYEEAGADIIFFEAPQSMEEIAAIPKTIKAPLLLNIVVGGKTPTVSTAQAKDLGFSLLLYANAALQGALQGTQAALASLRDNGSIDEASGLLASFKERQRMVAKPQFDAMDETYASEQS
ncbi:isocitrate lyase/PEP mutase family protein [Rhizobium halophytocola]|uniref:2-methylisocitrate lyase-like PEP mutase family enzyme n=1 Tax=Rhizobium halophytocola TaxID=735519 RepID=A0ABS4DSG8_9HYPH|nr:isocitrate lyase/PEP mutase family protein [Rhizobium halophytocola]MBP1848633.1 2-methylisocitrate lyase-like PEP mutase family enzyme [Rhizobium halophytocola]